MDKTIIDISLPIKTGMPVFPANPEVTVERYNTGHSFISKIAFGSHTGTHIDAPCHVSELGSSVDQIDLDSMLGPCRVLNLTHVEESITLTEIKKHSIQKGERIILKTKNSARGFDVYYSDYVFLEGPAAKYLVERAVLMVGIDSLSINKAGGEDNSAHLELLKHGIPIFEGLDLSKVRPGNYLFFGLPLRLEGVDGAPARCVLIPN